jgi:hypothetical protein
VTDNHSGRSTLYDGLGNKQQLVVTIPDVAGTQGVGSADGIVFSGGSDFDLVPGDTTTAARFIFAQEDGTISAWAPSVPPPAPATISHKVVDQSDSNAIYKGLALA